MSDLLFASPFDVVGDEHPAVVRAYSRLFRKAVTEVGLRGDAAWSAIYGEAHQMPGVIFLEDGKPLAAAMSEIRPGGMIWALGGPRD